MKTHMRITINLDNRRQSGVLGLGGAAFLRSTWHQGQLVAGKSNHSPHAGHRRRVIDTLHKAKTKRKAATKTSPAFKISSRGELERPNQTFVDYMLDEA